MQLTLNDQEAQALVDAVKGRLDQLGASIAKADSIAFKRQVVAEGDALEAVYRKLGCEYPEWTETRDCVLQPEQQSEPQPDFSRGNI